MNMTVERVLRKNIALGVKEDIMDDFDMIQCEEVYDDGWFEDRWAEIKEAFLQPMVFIPWVECDCPLFEQP